MEGRLPQTTPRKILKALQRLGFVVDDIEGSHYYLSRGKHHTCIAFHSRDIPRRILMKIVKQSGFTIGDTKPYL